MLQHPQLPFIIQIVCHTCTEKTGTTFSAHRNKKSSRKLETTIVNEQRSKTHKLKFLSANNGPLSQYTLSLPRLTSVIDIKLVSRRNTENLSDMRDEHLKRFLFRAETLFTASMAQQHNILHCSVCIPVHQVWEGGN